METRSSVIDGKAVEPVSECRRPRRKYIDLTREWVEANNMGHMWKEDPVYGYDLGPELLGSYYSTGRDPVTGECIETYYLFDGDLTYSEFIAAQNRGDYETFTIRKKDPDEPTIFPAEYLPKIPPAWLDPDAPYICC